MAGQIGDQKRKRCMFFFLIPIILGGLVAGKLAAKNGKHIYVFFVYIFGRAGGGKIGAQKRNI